MGPTPRRPQLTAHALDGTRLPVGVQIAAMEVEIRRMVAADIPAIARLAQQAFERTYPFDWQSNAKALYDAVTSRTASVMVAVTRGEVIGYANLRTWPAGGWVDQVVVSQPYQRRGIGRQLLEAVVDAARARGLWKISLITSETDAGASPFFKACGWQVVGVMKDEIRKGQDGMLLSYVVDIELHPNRCDAPPPRDPNRSV